MAVLKCVDLVIKVSVVDTVFSSFGGHALLSLLKWPQPQIFSIIFSYILMKAFANLPFSGYLR